MNAEDKRDWLPGNPFDRSIEGFRIRNGSAHGPLSKKFFYSMMKAGVGPRVKRVLGKRIITPAAEREWQEAQDTPIDEKVRSARSARAGKLGLQSPDHPANRKRRGAS
jgi:hypothetical protein